MKIGQEIINLYPSPGFKYKISKKARIKQKNKNKSKLINNKNKEKYPSLDLLDLNNK